MIAPNSKKVELLAPAGNFEKLEIALHYGADAIYLAGKAFSLRNFCDNFELDEIGAAISLAHAGDAKIYITVNSYARPADLAPLEKYIHQLKRLKPDALIVSDPAVISVARSVAPELPLHLSTQANTTNQEAVRFWQKQGIERINAARELSLDEIAQLVDADRNIEIEAFVHGAMCISYSGRCLLSNFMARRPGNQGMCCQPCRFQYAVVEQTRPGQYFPLAEDDQGTYIFNSRDLCMLKELPALIASGIRSLKIEGRMKGIHYAATTVKVYRAAIDRYYSDPQGYTIEPYWQEELNKITSRGYCTGFYIGDPDQISPSYMPPQPPPHILVGKVLSSAGVGTAHIEVRNQIKTGQTVEILTPSGPPVLDRIRQITDIHGQKVEVANPGSRVTILLSTDCRRFDLLRQAHRICE
jgi:putative protease